MRLRVSKWPGKDTPTYWAATGSVVCSRSPTLVHCHSFSGELGWCSYLWVIIALSSVPYRAWVDICSHLSRNSFIQQLNWYPNPEKKKKKTAMEKCQRLQKGLGSLSEFWEVGVFPSLCCVSLIRENGCSGDFRTEPELETTKDQWVEACSWLYGWRMGCWEVRRKWKIQALLLVCVVFLLWDFWTLFSANWPKTLE